MHAINTHTNWQSHTKLQHWIKHSLIPVALIVVFLWLPKPWTLALFQPNSVIEVELIETQQPLPDISTAELVKPPVEPVIEAPLETAIITAKPLTQEVPKTAVQTDSVPPQSVQPMTIQSKEIKPQINATDVIQMIQDRTSIVVPIEFQARTGPATDFYIPKQEVHDWLADIPFLDESVDKPKLQMKFYAEGIEGSIEKFFDKITISKTFTTKYGTQIHCALIGVIAVCGWK